MFNFFGEKNKKKEEQKVDMSIIDKICNMTYDQKSRYNIKQLNNFLRNLIQSYKTSNVPLSIMNVTWEDTGRNAFSCVGPNISDMTLQVQGRQLPVIRHENFSDFTMDIDSDEILLKIGNESKGRENSQISLTEYLNNFHQYLTNGSCLKKGRCLLKDKGKNERIIVSSQACIVPVQKGGETKFNVDLYNYQAMNDDPAVLGIIANKAGTSAQIIKPGGQSLYFNQEGQRCSFIAERASDFKENLVKTGKIQNDAQDQEAEQLMKEMNVIYMIQVPLKQKEKARQKWSDGVFSMNFSCYSMQQECEQEMSCDMEDAVVKIGEAEGLFDELNGLDIERDTRFPVRLTLQFYKASGDGLINNTAMKEIQTSIQQVEDKGYNFRSLVTGEQVKFEKNQEIIPICPQQHKMGKFAHGVNVYEKLNGWAACNQCEVKKLHEQQYYFHCKECGFDLCSNCSSDQQSLFTDQSKKCEKIHNMYRYKNRKPAGMEKGNTIVLCTICKGQNLEKYQCYYGCPLCPESYQCNFCFENSDPKNHEKCLVCHQSEYLRPIVYGKQSKSMINSINNKQLELFECNFHDKHPSQICIKCQKYC